EQGVQVIATDIDGLRLRVEREQTVADQKAIYGEIDHGVQYGGVGFGLPLRLRDIRGAVRKHHDVGLRLEDSQVRDVQKAAQAGKQANVHLDLGGAYPRGGFRRLLAVNHEVVYDCFQAAGAERERPDFHTATGAFRGCSNDLLAHVFAEPIGLHHDDCGDD